MSLRNKPLLALVLVALLARATQATWSIIIVNTVTKEIAVGSCTCLTNLDLRLTTPVVLVGTGAATAQSAIDGNAINRMLIAQEMQNGTPLAAILALLAGQDGIHQQRQYGMATTAGETLTFTGAGAGAWAGGVTGQVGDLIYNVQGNVLTGAPVVSMAEAAILNTPGDLAEKLMASMEAARLMGGDGRCSCSVVAPTSCGAPPASFIKSAHIGFMIVARLGDTDGPCNGAVGCAAGNYYMNFNIANQPASALDPVLQMQALFTTWRQTLIGRPDHLLSTVTLADPALAANGAETTTATLTVRDWQGTVLAPGGHVVNVTVDPTSSGAATIGAVIDHGDGTYTFPVTAGVMPGEVRLEVTVDNGSGPVLLAPFPTLQLPTPFLVCGAGTAGAAGGGPFDVLSVNGGGGAPGRFVEVGLGEPLTLSMAAPPTNPPGAATPPHFALFGWTGIPGPADAVVIPTAGEMCFPPAPLGLGGFTVANTFGSTPPSLLAATPAPWSFTAPAGITVPGDYILQGVVIDDPANQLAVTNAIAIHAIPLPPPTIAAVTPVVGSPGDVVTISGSDFRPGAAIDVGGAPVAALAITPDEVTFAIPPTVPCDTTLTVTNPDGQNASHAFNPSPTINVQFTPGGAPAAGNGVYIVVGLNFTPGTTMTMDGNPVTVTNSTTSGISVLTPAGVSGSTVPVVITTPLGCTVATTYTYD